MSTMSRYGYVAKKTYTHKCVGSNCGVTSATYSADTLPRGWTRRDINSPLCRRCSKHRPRKER